MKDDDALRGVPMRLSPGWLREVERELGKRGWNQAELSRQCGAGESTLSRMFASRVGSTRTIRQISNVLGVSDPVEQLLDDEVQSWVYSGVRLREFDKDKFAKIMGDLELLVRQYDKIDETLDTIRPPR